jgi:class I fructose-bisphosphate aldolase
MPVQTAGSKIEEILGDEAASLLQYQCKTIPKETLHLPGPDYVERIYSISDRPTRVLTSLQSMLDHGRLGGTGYVSILPVDQGIEHSAGASFAPNPMYFDPENIVKLAIEGGCNAVASTLGVLGSVGRRYAHKIPFLLKLNHNEFLSYPNAYDQIKFASPKQAFDMGAQAIGATIYFGSEESKRQIVEVNNGGYNAVNFGKTHKKVYSELSSDHPIDLTRYQLANCYMGRAGLINSGGASSGESDLKEAVKTAIINKRAGGMGLISGRKAFQRPMKEGAQLLNAIQDVYLNQDVTIA